LNDRITFFGATHRNTAGFGRQIRRQCDTKDRSGAGVDTFDGAVAADDDDMVR
jgi:hypothetical protein